MSSNKARFQSTAILGVIVAVAALSVLSAQTPPSRLLVLLGDSKAVAVVDPASGKVLGRAPTDDDPHTVAVSDDGKLAFTGNMAPGTISVIDVATQKELRRVDVGAGSQPSRVVFAGGKVYFTAGGYKAIGRYDPPSNKVDWLIGTGGNASFLAVTPDKDKVFVSDREKNCVYAIEGVLAGPPKWNVTTIAVGGSPEGMDVSPDGKEVWAAKRFGGGISIIDVATKKLTQLDVTFPKSDGKGSQATRLNFTPDGKRVLLLHRPTQDIVVFDASTRKEIKRIKVPGDGMLITPDSSRAYVSVEPPDKGPTFVEVIDLKTLEISGRVEVPPGTPVPCRGACDAFAMAWSGK